MSVNPNAIAFWVATTGIGWLLNMSVRGAVVGLVVGCSASVLVAVFGVRR